MVLIGYYGGWTVEVNTGAARAVKDRQTHTHTQTTVTLLRMRRGLIVEFVAYRCHEDLVPPCPRYHISGESLPQGLKSRNYRPESKLSR